MPLARPLQPLGALEVGEPVADQPAEQAADEDRRRTRGSGRRVDGSEVGA